MSEYLSAITEILGRIESEEAAKLSAAAEAVAETICRDGIIHTFGCGHSHLPTLDTFYRAGGLACTSPILDEDLMLHNGAAKSSRMEKMSGIAAEAFRRACVDPEKDLLVVILLGRFSFCLIKSVANNTGHKIHYITKCILVAAHQTDFSVR